MLNDVGGRLIHVHAQFFQSSDTKLFLILIINGNRSHFSQAMRLYMFSQKLKKKYFKTWFDLDVVCFPYCFCCMDVQILYYMNDLVLQS